MKIHHDQIKEQVAVLGEFLVEFDEEGNGIIEDEDYAKQLLKDDLGFSKIEVEKPDEKAKKEEKLEKPQEPESKTPKIVTRRAAKTDK